MSKNHQVIFFQQSEFNQALENGKRFVARANELLDQHKMYGQLFTLNTVAQLYRIIMGAGAASKEYENCLMENVTIPEAAPGIRMKKEVFVQNYDLPDFTGLNQRFRYAHTEGLDQHLCRFENGIVEINPDAVEKLRTRYTIFADTKEKQEIMEAHQEAARHLEKLRKLHDKFKLYRLNRDSEYRHLFGFDEDGSVRPNWSYYAGEGYLRGE